MIGSIISASAALGGAIIGAVSRKRAQLRQNAYNAQAAETEYQRNLEQWNRENEYNLPSNQVQRLKDANLNPNLAYGNGIGGSQSVTSPTYDAPEQDYSTPVENPQQSILGVVQVLQQIQMQNAQLKNLEMQNNYMQSRLDGQEIVNSVNAKFLEGDRSLSQQYNALRMGELNNRIYNVALKNGILEAQAQYAPQMAEENYNATVLSNAINRYKLDELLPADLNLTKLRTRAQFIDMMYNEEGNKNDMWFKALEQRVANRQGSADDYLNYFITRLLRDGLGSLVFGSSSSFHFNNSKNSHSSENYHNNYGNTYYRR